MANDAPRDARLQSRRAVSTFACPAQVLVIDRPGGPAHLLLDSISRLLPGEVAFALAANCQSAVRALAVGDLDLVAVGLEDDRLEQLAFLPRICGERPDVPVVLVGERLTRQRREWARQRGVHDVVEKPRRAAELRSLVLHVARRYLHIY